ncbi:hypothetical protein ACFSKU_00285 [Pontibacter silvestris]|uniref:Uncharacterized protein n=1 Tax=Pontibacter silvestris TaxID=2305183 RepID=A0ABW4WR95_9BACT|nr:hypothetical protein [Pontibacter silvestris]MCC9138199.1 hypothetical protein [Pontibacter silvestris]
MKSFYDYNRNNPEERRERNLLYPEMAKFHIALREELGEEEYQQFYRAEKEANRRVAPALLNQTNSRWATV